MEQFPCTALAAAAAAAADWCTASSWLPNHKLRAGKRHPGRDEESEALT